MSSKDPVFERSRSVEDMQHLRLMALLSELVRDKGVMQAAQELEVDHRTLTAGLESGRLSRRLRGALEKALLEGGGSPAQEQRERNDALEARVEVLEKGVEALGREMRQGLAAVQGEVRTLREQQTQGMRRLARLETGEDAPDGDRNADSGGDGKARGRPAPRRKTVLRREFPELATLEPAGDDEGVFGQAWPLILEWRALKETHPDRGKGLDWLRQEERFLMVELALLEERGLTLPPETYPLRGLDRGGQVNWRRKALVDTRRARKRREILLRLRRLLSPGAWRR